MLRAGIWSSVLIASAVLVSARGGEGSDRPLDKDFLVKAASANHAEIEISRLADKRAASSPVKDFAAMIVKDHKHAYDQVADLLTRRKIGVVTGLEKETKEELGRLGKLEGAEFDRAYLRCMIQQHKDAIAIFENQAKNGRETEIRDYARSMLPDLRKHLGKAQELAKSSDR